MLKCPAGSWSFATVIPAISVDFPGASPPLTITIPLLGR